MNDRTFEFGEAENRVMQRTATAARLLGGAVIVQGLLGLLDIKDSLVATLLGLVISVIIGASFIQGGNALQRVVSTEGWDVPHLLEALTQLTRAFTIRVTLLLLVVGILALGLLVLTLLAITA